MTGAAVEMRLATDQDAETLAGLHRRVRDACLPYLPRLHTPEDDLRFFREVVLPACRVWVATRQGRMAGFAAARPGWLDHLYVDLGQQGFGVGSKLLLEAQRGQDALQLWTFQRNAAARRFYEGRAFRLVELTDGSGNEEREPDARYEWRRRPP